MSQYADLIERLRGLLEKATPGPWHLCQHLKSVEDDAACRCGYRGVIFGPEREVDYAVFQPGHEPAPKGEEGTEPARYPRQTEIANAQITVTMRNALPTLLDAIASLEAEREGLRDTLDKAAVRFEHCAKMIETSFSIGGTLRMQRALKAAEYADEARAALQPKGPPR